MLGIISQVLATLRSHWLVSWQMFNNGSPSEGKAWFVAFAWFVAYKYLHHSWFQAADMTSLNTEVGRDVHIVSPAGMSWYEPAHHWLGRLWLSLQILEDCSEGTYRWRTSANLKAGNFRVLPQRSVWAVILFAAPEMACAVTYMH